VVNDQEQLLHRVIRRGLVHPEASRAPPDELDEGRIDAVDALMRVGSRVVAAFSWGALSEFAQTEASTFPE
jgi:hypothetical protein